MRIQTLVGQVMDGGQVRQLYTKLTIYRVRIRTDPGGDWIWLFAQGITARTLCMNLVPGMWIAAVGVMRHWRDKNGQRTEYLDCKQIQLMTRYVEHEVDNLTTEAEAIAEVMRE